MSKDQNNMEESEKKLIKFWKKENVYKFDKTLKKEIYSVDTPPPFLSGKMHIGHAFMYSQMDFIARFMRMSGKNVFYPFGSDDNGLPTERFVEKINKVKSTDMQRAEFIKLCLKTLKETTGEFIDDWIRLGISCDYGLYYSTIDETSQRISQQSFIELLEKKQIYKKKFPTIWCPECQTAIAQAELEDKKFDSSFLTLKFRCEGKDFLISTTRPELLGACIAVFVNPDDKRYKSIIGKKAEVPLFKSEVPIIADSSAEMEKGTGVLMVCSYGDKYDVEAVQRYNLLPKVIFSEEGKMISGDYAGLKIKEAREKITEDLKKNKLIESKKTISHIVNVHDKCGTEIEFIPTAQWFIKIIDKKKEMIDQGEKIRWSPEFMFKRYRNWVEGLEWDWNISRNRSFGVPIPVWNCEKCGEIILAEKKELPVDPLQKTKKCRKCNSIAVGESMVLDTWATSSMSPQIASELIGGNIKIPYSLRPQGHDIIRTWAFYTIVKSYLHKKEIPWKDIIITGNVSLNGEKMSKSRGNVISPQEVMKKFSADAMRFWAASSKLGGDLDYSEKELIAGEKMIKKLINASNFVFMNLNDWNFKRPEKIEKTDGIFLGKLNEVIKTSTDYFQNYEFSRAKQKTENFFRQIFCDNYLEIIKKRIYNEKGDSKKSAQYTIYHSLLSILKLFAPIMPFATEEIYQKNFRKYEKNKSIHNSKWPEKIEGGRISDGILDLMIKIITLARQEKTIAKKPMNSEIILTIEKKDKEKLKEVLNDLKNVTGAKEIMEGKFEVKF